MKSKLYFLILSGNAQHFSTGALLDITHLPLVFMSILVLEMQKGTERQMSHNLTHMIELSKLSS
jgi:hypothetical protein